MSSAPLDEDPPPPVSTPVCSPELALVDPELAAWARAALPTRAWEREPAAAPIRAARSATKPRPARRAWRSAAVAASAVAALAVALAVGAAAWMRSPSESPARADAVRSAAHVVRTRRRDADSPARRAAAPSLLAWAPVRRATHYDLRLVRGRKLVFEARPHQARLRLPPTLHLAKGRYRWSVRAGFGRVSDRRYGQPLVQAMLRIP